MNTGKTIFSQVIDFLPIMTFANVFNVMRAITK